MRATAEEVLRGIQYALVHEILPDLKSAYVQSQVPLMVMAVEGVIHRWDSAVQDLLEENRDLTELLEQAAAVIDGMSDRNEELSALARELRKTATCPYDGPLTVSALTERNNQLKGAVEKLLVLCESAAKRPDCGPLMAVRRKTYRRLWEALSKQWTFPTPSRPPSPPPP